jgi:hypothetical protein
MQLPELFPPTRPESKFGIKTESEGIVSNTFPVSPVKKHRRPGEGLRADPERAGRLARVIIVLH